MDNGKVGSRLIPETLPTCTITPRNQLLIPNKALTNKDLENYAHCLKIPFFRGVFMKDELPKSIWKNETGIVNLDDSTGLGTHWICYKKLGNTVYYFDSFGNIPPVKELQFYFQPANCVMYNYNRYQHFNTDICGHLCLEFLATSISMI